MKVPSSILDPSLFTRHISPWTICYTRKYFCFFPCALTFLGFSSNFLPFFLWGATNLIKCLSKNRCVCLVSIFDAFNQKDFLSSFQVIGFIHFKISKSYLQTPFLKWNDLHTLSFDWHIPIFAVNSCTYITRCLLYLYISVCQSNFGCANHLNFPNDWHMLNYTYFGRNR